jgi:hypothetical protein
MRLNIIMKLSHLFIVGAISLLSFSGCDDEDCTAGTGGDLTFVVSPKHHGEDIYSQGNYRDTVYIKFNTQEFPGANPSAYDIIAIGDSGEEHVHIHGLRCGDYYIYAVGIDTSLGERVFGGKPFSTTETSGEISIDVPVVE